MILLQKRTCIRNSADGKDDWDIFLSRIELNYLWPLGVFSSNWYREMGKNIEKIGQGLV